MKIPSPIHIETICCIDRVKTFSAAAVHLHTTQSAISARVRDLEDLLGVQLFQRNGRTVELTLEGRRFVDITRPLMQQLEEAVSSFQDTAAMSGRIRISAGNSSMITVARMLTDLQRISPSISYDFEVQHTNAMVRDLRLGRIDLAVFPTPTDNLEQQNIVSYSLGFEPVQWLITPELLKQHQGKDPDDIQALLDKLPVWCLPRPAAHFEAALDSLRSRGGVIKYLNTSNNLPATMDIIAAGAGIGLLTNCLSAAHRKAGTLVPAFRNVHPPAIEFFIARSRDRHSPMLQRFIDIAIKTSAFNASNPDKKRKRDTS
ncbi:LysR family transcriptional regulator [Alcaligenaceae bacterium]|nr:LysR family transcriptional regulator [Alcaligenaceae bacterium]